MTESYSTDQRLTALWIEIAKIVIGILTLLLVGVAVGSGVLSLYVAVSAISMPSYIILGTGIGGLWLVAASMFLLLVYAYGERQRGYSL